MARQREAGAGWTLLCVARMFPLAALGLWIAMLWVPVFASPQRQPGSVQAPPGSPQPPRIIVTALGGPAFDFESAHTDTLLVGLGVIVCALTAVLLALRPHISLLLWSAATLILGACALGVLATRFEDPPILMWDAVDGSGRRVFDTVIAEPAPGALLWTVGSLILGVAGVCGLIGEYRRGRVRQITSSIGIRPA